MILCHSLLCTSCRHNWVAVLLTRPVFLLQKIEYRVSVRSYAYQCTDPPAGVQLSRSECDVDGETASESLWLLLRQGNANNIVELLKELYTDTAAAYTEKWLRVFSAVRKNCAVTHLFLNQSCHYSYSYSYRITLFNYVLRGIMQCWLV